MPNFITQRLRLFLRSELDLQKDRLLQELKGEKVWHREEERIHVDKALSVLAERRGLTLERVKKDFVVEGFSHLERLVNNVGATLNVLEDGRLEIRIGSAAFIPETAQEIRILTEIFEDEVYLVESKEPLYVWDIGANVATASLYFASVHGWDASAYELFPQTAEAAKNNIDRSGLSDRIKLNAFGIGRKTETLSLKYNEHSRGSNGLFGNTDPWVSGDETSVDVKVVDAAEEIQNVLMLANNRPILAKLDCEGAEYEIIPRLIETNNLRWIAAMIMEEHVLPGHDREKLVEAVQEAGFIVRRTRRLDKHVSMLFASRIGS